MKKPLTRVKCEATLADVTGDTTDLAVHHLLVQMFDVERLNSEGQSSCQHGKHAHSSARTYEDNMHKQKHIYIMYTQKCIL